MRKKATASFLNLVDITQQIQRRLESGWAASAAVNLEIARQQYEKAIFDSVSWQSICDQTAQTIVCLSAAWPRLPAAMRTPQVRRWLIQQAHPLWREPLNVASRDAIQPDDCLWDMPLGDLLVSSRIANHAESMWAGDAAHRDASLAHFFERFLMEYRAHERRRRGVFFTPLPIVRAMMNTVNRLLIEHFKLPLGLGNFCAEHGTNQILDPAAGCGTFLSEALRLALQQYQRAQSAAKDSLAVDETQVAIERLVPQIQGYDVLLPACALAQIAMAATLLDVGYTFRTPLPLAVVPHNTLASPHAPHSNEKPVRAVVVGNPPFSGISSNQQPWISALLRGCGADSAGVKSYFHVSGQPLGERKVWLNDDYVKFFRYAQWHVERTGQGLIAFVSNHAYLDNATFRGLRASLLHTFPQVSIIDLHGNAKRRERAPSGGVDENVFAIEQGVSIGYFLRPPGQSTTKICRADMWGTAARKLTQLTTEEIPFYPVHPSAPHYLFMRPVQTKGLPQGIALDELMPVHCTAPITARDHFVVALELEDLSARLQDFADLNIDDETIRQRYFRRTRSDQYQAGDTRGWKLADARRRLAACSEPENWVRACWYRPFDRRFVFWADWMIDWPRPNLTRQAALNTNWFLITRRQMLPDGAANFFWISDALALDGIIRSDNRGSETLLPIYAVNGSDCQPNFASDYVRDFAQRFELKWKRSGQGNLHSHLGPEDLADYIYALFWSTRYRSEYAESFCTGFPRVITARNADLLRQMVLIGRQLRRCHVLRDLQQIEASQSFFGEEKSAVIDVGFPRFRENQIWLNRHTGFANVPESVWKFTVGAHQVCRKWLVARRGRLLNRDDILHFKGILGAISQTERLVQELDLAIEQSNGISKGFD